MENFDTSTYSAAVEDLPLLQSEVGEKWKQPSLLSLIPTVTPSSKTTGPTSQSPKTSETITKDIRDYHCQPGDFDLITAGFPCTGTNNAGTRTGLNHPESALFREVLRIIAECQPRFSIIEQPLGVIDRGLRAMLGGLRMVGYQSELEVISAAELGAGHCRQRLFIIS